MNLEQHTPAPTERRMKNARIKVEVKPGMFSSEKFVRFTVGDQTYQSYVDETDVDGDELRVYVIATGEKDVLIDLPRDTLAHGSRVQIPKNLIIW